ncbi:hypothetical protein Tco_1403288 [Tanacetum coccineum]
MNNSDAIAYRFEKTLQLCLFDGSKPKNNDELQLRVSNFFKNFDSNGGDDLCYQGGLEQRFLGLYQQKHPLRGGIPTKWEVVCGGVRLRGNGGLIQGYLGDQVGRIKLSAAHLRHYQSPPSPHGRDVTTQFPLLISFHGERTANSVNDILMFQLHHGILYLKHGDSFKATYYKKVPRLGINLWLQVQIFLYHVNPSQGRTFDQSAVLETTTRDFVQASQGIALASRCLVYIRPSAYELETKVQRLDGSSLAMTTTTQVNKVKPLVKSAVGPHDTLLLHGISRKSLCWNMPHRLP